MLLLRKIFSALVATVNRKETEGKGRTYRNTFTSLSSEITAINGTFRSKNLPFIRSVPRVALGLVNVVLVATEVKSFLRRKQ